MDKISGFIVVQTKDNTQLFHGPFSTADKAVEWMTEANHCRAGTLVLRELYIPYDFKLNQ
jgi:hypothetical protein